MLRRQPYQPPPQGGESRALLLVGGEEEQKQVDVVSRKKKPITTTTTTKTATRRLRGLKSIFRPRHQDDSREASFATRGTGSESATPPPPPHHHHHPHNDINNINMNDTINDYEENKPTLQRQSGRRGGLAPIPSMILLQVDHDDALSLGEQSPLLEYWSDDFDNNNNNNNNNNNEYQHQELGIAPTSGEQPSLPQQQQEAEQENYTGGGTFKPETYHPHTTTIAGVPYKIQVLTRAATTSSPTSTSQDYNNNNNNRGGLSCITDDCPSDNYSMVLCPEENDNNNNSNSNRRRRNRRHHNDEDHQQELPVVVLTTSKPASTISVLTDHAEYSQYGIYSVADEIQQLEDSFAPHSSSSVSEALKNNGLDRSKQRRGADDVYVIDDDEGCSLTLESFRAMNDISSESSSSHRRHLRRHRTSSSQSSASYHSNYDDFSLDPAQELLSLESF